MIPEESILKETITIIRPAQTNNVLNDTDYLITRFTSKGGKEVAYFEKKDVVDAQN